MRRSSFATGYIPATREHGGVLVVEAVVNGVRGVRLMADTGATWTALTPESLERIGMDRTRPAGTLVVAVAQSRESLLVPTFRIDNLELGPFKTEGLQITMLELPPQLAIDGLLGVNFLERFRATFDFDNGALVLRQRTA